MGIFGWQGIVPRRAGKVGSTTIHLLTSNLLKPEELLDRFDVDEALDRLQDPLNEAIEEIIRDLAEEVRPGLWDNLPEAGRRAVRDRIVGQIPQLTQNLMTEIKSDLPGTSTSSSWP